MRTTGRRQVLRALAAAPALFALGTGRAAADPPWSVARPGSVVTRDGVRVSYYEYGPGPTEAPTIYFRLEIPVVQVVQPTLELIEHRILTDVLENRVPRLIRHDISATHLSFVLHARTLSTWIDEVVSGFESGAMR